MTQIDDRPGQTRRALRSWEKIEEPLERVVGLADMLRDRSRDMSGAARNEIVDQLTLHAKVAQHALDNMIVGVQLQGGEVPIAPDAVDLRELVETVAQEWTIERGAQITVTGAIGALCDRSWTGFLLGNIFEDIYGRGGRNIAVRISAGYSKAVVEVEDDGEKIPQSDIDALADSQHRSQSVTWDGAVLGQGVAVARGLARLMGGDVRYFGYDGVNRCELTLRKHGQEVSRRGQLPNFTVDPVSSEPSRHDILELLDDGSLTMVYQSVVDLRLSGQGSAAVIGYESFARFPYAAPPVWFKLAGSAGVGVELELLALRAGIESFSTRDDDAFLALNLSNATLLAPQLSAAIEAIDPGRLVLELSDTARIRSYEVTRRAVDALRERGLRLAVDDVGASEIDMWHILRLDPDIIKLDRHLVADQQNIRRNDALIRGITTMANDLGIMVIAEAIETETERRRLLELGVEFGQGYLFGKPEPLQWKTRVLSDSLDQTGDAGV